MQKRYVILDQNPDNLGNNDFIILGRKNHYSNTFAANCPMLFGGTATAEEPPLDTIVREVHEESEGHIKVYNIIPKPYKYVHNQLVIKVYKCINFDYDNHHTTNGEFSAILKVSKGKLMNKLNILPHVNKDNFAFELYALTENPNHPTDDKHYQEFRSSDSLDALFKYGKEIGLFH